MFAPLSQSAKATLGLPKLRGVVFDMDGTLCEPQQWMFSRMRTALGIDKSIDILDHIEALPTDRQPEAEEAIRSIEREGMIQMVAQPGLVPLMEYLARRNIKKAICTRNFDGPTQHLVSSFLGGIEISPIITRSFKPPKPHPAGILSIASEWNIDTSEMIMVGDSVDDMVAGRRAGCKTVLLLAKEGHNKHLVEEEHTDAYIRRLDDLIDILENGTLGVSTTTSPKL